MSGILRTARALCGLLSPTTGARATGTLTVHSTSGTVQLPKYSYAVPLVGGQLEHGLILKTTAAVTATVGGASVAVTAAVGGAAANLATSTVVRWDPPLTGIESTSTINAPGLAGGTVPTYFGAAQQLRIYEQIGKGADDLLAAKVGRFPALVLFWDGTGVEAQSRAGRTRNLSIERWTLAIISSRLDSQEERRAEALQLLDDATDLLTDHTEADGEIVSGPSPIRITNRRRLTVAPTVLVYAIDFTTERTLEMRDARTFNPWLTAQVETKTQTGLPPEEVVVRDIKIPIPT